MKRGRRNTQALVHHIQIAVLVFDLPMGDYEDGDKKAVRVNHLLGAGEALVGLTTGRIRCCFARGAGTVVGESFVFLLVVSTKFDFINCPT
jgi:hypothetical protein